MNFEVRRLPFSRPESGLEWGTCYECPFSRSVLEVGGIGWFSRRAGTPTLPTYNHLAQRRLDIELDSPVLMSKVEVYGIFALGDCESDNSEGANLYFLRFFRDERLVHSIEFVEGVHFKQGRGSESRELAFGDGGMLKTIGIAEPASGEPVAVDLITYDFEEPFHCDRIVFADESSGTCAVIFDVFAYSSEANRCPFRDASTGVPFGEIPKIVRLADLKKFAGASGLVEEAILEPTRQLDDAKGMALTHLAVVCAAGLETGASSRMHRVQLDAARRIDKCETLSAVVEEWKKILDEITEEVMPTSSGTSDALIDRAVDIIQKNYASALDDSDIARRLGLSTSHFRHLFKLRTKKPFRKYLQAVRLERSKELLVDTDLPIAAIARAVGFASPAHFTRAVQAHFGAPPSALRRRVR